MVPQLYESTEDSADSIAINTVYPIVPVDRIRNYIQQADGRINASLRKVYGADITITPVYTIPTANYNNTGTGTLNYLNDTGKEMTLSATKTKTDVIKINFTGDSGAFAVSSQLYGSLGTGDTGSTFTASNSCIAFDSTHWINIEGVETNDRFYIRTYNIDQILAINFLINNN